MQNTQTGQMTAFDTWDDVVAARKKNPNTWGAIFHQGEKVKVVNEDGEEGTFRIRSFGKKFMQLESIVVTDE